MTLAFKKVLIESQSKVNPRIGAQTVWVCKISITLCPIEMNTSEIGSNFKTKGIGKVSYFKKIACKALHQNSAPYTLFWFYYLHNSRYG